MYRVGGKWNGATEGIGTTDVRSIGAQIKQMSIDGAMYLRHSFFGPLVFLKASGMVAYGASEVLNVSFSEPYGISDNDSPMRLGMLFACMGIGCTLFPLIADAWTDMKEPISIQRASIGALFIETLGLFGVAFFHPFWSVCAFTLARAGGGCANWIDSLILLQKFSSDEMMGRVLAVDYALALLSEAIAAFATGYLEDNTNLLAHEVALVMAIVGTILTLIWLVYHINGGGAASPAATVIAAQDREPSYAAPLIVNEKQTSSSLPNETSPLISKEAKQESYDYDESATIFVEVKIVSE